MNEIDWERQAAEQAGGPRREKPSKWPINSAKINRSMAAAD